MITCNNPCFIRPEYHSPLIHSPVNVTISPSQTSHSISFRKRRFLECHISSIPSRFEGIFDCFSTYFAFRIELVYNLLIGHSTCHFRLKNKLFKLINLFLIQLWWTSCLMMLWCRLMFFTSILNCTFCASYNSCNIFILPFGVVLRVRILRRSWRDSRLRGGVRGGSGVC